MKWSWKLTEIAGIGVHVHATFFILVGWLALSYWLVGHSLATMAVGVGFILALFGCILLHELGHAMAAKRYGIKTRDITLLPIGGLACLEQMPDDPKQELVVALAGPAVNVVITGVLWGWLWLTGSLVPLGQLSATGGPFLERLMVVNVILVVFNMLPAFPMDGGRVLRALLATRVEYAQATQVAANIGQATAFFFGFIGLFVNPFLLLIALFVWVGAAQEASMVQMKSALGGILVSRAMLTDFRTVSPQDSVGQALKLALTVSHKDFPVVENERVKGVLTREDLLVAFVQRGPKAAVGEVMQHQVQEADSHEMLAGVLARLPACECHTRPVRHDGKLVGLLTPDTVGEFLGIHAGLSGKAQT